MNLEKLFTFLESEGKIEITEGFKSKLTDTISVALSEKDAEIEKGKALLKEAATKIDTLETEVKQIKETVLEDVSKEVTAFKESLVEKMDSFLEAEMKTLVPENLIESEAKLEIYEPLVEGFKSTIAGFGIKIDSEGHNLLKDAKKEIERLSEEVNQKTENFMKLESVAGKLLAKTTLMEKCSGLTNEQAEKINVIFAGKDVEEINEKFDSIRDLIVNEKTETKTVPTKVEETVNEEVKDENTDEMKMLQESCGVKYV